MRSNTNISNIKEVLEKVQSPLKNLISGLDQNVRPHLASSSIKQEHGFDDGFEDRKFSDQIWPDAPWDDKFGDEDP